MRKVLWSQVFKKVPLLLLCLFTKIDFYYLNQANIQTHNAYKVSEAKKRRKKSYSLSHEEKRKEQNEFHAVVTES